MKSRISLVSNSSSSSFIINKPIELVAFDMLTAKYKYYDDTYDDVPEEEKRLKDFEVLKKALQRKDVIEGKIGIFFQSCNYDTFIIQTEVGCKVDTCNNIDWYSYIEGMNGFYSSDENIIGPGNFYSIDADQVLNKECFGNDDNTFECPVCKSYGEVSYMYYKDQNGKPYCSTHYVEMEELKKKQNA